MDGQKGKVLPNKPQHGHVHGVGVVSGLIELKRQAQEQQIIGYVSGTQILSLVFGKKQLIFMLVSLGQLLHREQGAGVMANHLSGLSVQNTPRSS